MAKTHIAACVDDEKLLLTLSAYACFEMTTLSIMFCG
jgi:hypothetical protein